MNPDNNTWREAKSSEARRLISYFELFDYPLKIEELTNFLGTDNITPVVQRLNDEKFIEISDGYIYPSSKKYIINKRNEGEDYFKSNHKRIRFVSWIIAHIPFVRSIILTGSASKECMPSNDDFDFLIITSKNRLWLCRTLIYLLRRIVSLNGRNFNNKYFCCNYYIDNSNTEIKDQNEFIALETYFAKPTYGMKFYRNFLEANKWIKDYYPNFDGNKEIPSFFLHFNFLKYPAEWIINITIYMINIIFGKNFFENKLMNLYISHWDKIGVLNERYESIDKISNKYVRPPNGNLRQKFLLERLMNPNIEFRSALRTNIMLMKLSGPTNGGIIQPDILLTHAFYLNASRTEKKIMKPNVPLGPLYIGSYLKEKGYKIDFFDTTFKKSIKDFRKYLIKINPPMVGIYIIEPTKKNALKMIKIAKDFGAVVIAGGPDPSIKPKYYIENGVDAVVVGEGEETAFELMESIYKGNRDITKIPGLYTSTGYTPRQMIEDLDSIPVPAREIIDYTKYFQAWQNKGNFKTMFIITSRGCPFHCSWCSKPVFGSCFRTRSPKNVVDEIKLLEEKYHPERYWINDDIFGLNKRWITEFHEELKKTGIKIKFECLSRVDLVNEETLRNLKESGCFRIWFGAESGSDKILDSMKKGFKAEQIKKAVSLAHSQGIEVSLFMMLGYPGEELNDIELTRQLIKDTIPQNVGITIAYPLEGTEFYEEVKSVLLNQKNKYFTDLNARIIFKTKYSLLFYKLVRRLITSELNLLKNSMQSNQIHRIKLNMYRLAYNSYKFYYTKFRNQA